MPETCLSSREKTQTRLNISFEGISQGGEKKTNMSRFLAVCREIIFEVVPLLSNHSVTKKDMQGAKFASRRGSLSSQASFRDLCGNGGVQLGKTKVFFRQVRRDEVYKNI